METGVFSKSWFSSVILYSMLAWTIICFIGTWFVILKYRILFEELITIVVTFFFAVAIWGIPLIVGLILLSDYLTPPEESPPYVMFRELIKRGMRRSSE